jgi:type I restriction enzyme R subunit
MIEFKQIIGRGTRLFEGKDYFTIYDFVKAYEHFNDEEWDGEPAEPVPATPSGGDGGSGPPGDDNGGDNGDGPGGDDPPPREKIKIKLADGKERTIQHMMATMFWNPDGTPMSATEFVQQLFGDLPELFKNEDELRALWSIPDTRKSLLERLAEKGYGDEQLAEIKLMIDAKKSDLFDVLAYIAFALVPITRQERVDTHKDIILSKYDEKLQAFLDFVLNEYVKEGVYELDDAKLPHLLELKYGSVDDAAEQLGGVSRIRDAFIGFQEHLYHSV